MRNYRLSDILEISASQMKSNSKHIDPNTLITAIEDAGKTISVKPDWSGISSKKGTENRVCKINIPIVIEEQHLGSLLMSQFFFEEENIARYYLLRKADKIGFHIDGYLTALYQLPVFAKEEVNYFSSYYKAMTRFISALSEQPVKATEAKDSLTGCRGEKRTLVNNVPIGICRITPGNSQFIKVNPAMVKMFGYDSMDEFMGISISNPFRNVNEWDSLVEESGSKGFATNSKLMLSKKNGVTMWCSCTASTQFDQDGSIKYVDAVFEDITESRKLLDELNVLADKDPLTSVFNRKRFLELLAIELKTAGLNKRPLALIMLDIDHFCFVNDRRGHAIGDLFLQTTANIIGSSIKTTDLLARFSGDGFAIICPDTNIEKAMALAETIRISIEEYTFPADIGITISAGVSVFNDSDSETTFITRADDALHSAKTKGRNRVEIKTAEEQQADRDNYCN